MSHQTRDIAGILHFLTPQQMAEEIVRLDALVAAPQPGPSEAQLVCYEAYQVVGTLLSDLGKFDTPQAQKILDNLHVAKMIHGDVLPWESYAAPQPAPSGWKLVPVEPTQAMLEAVAPFPAHLSDKYPPGHEWHAKMRAATTADQLAARSTYRAMLAASPHHTDSGGGEVKPVAYLIKRDKKVYGIDLRESFGEFYAGTKETADEYMAKGWKVTPLYTHPASGEMRNCGEKGEAEFCIEDAGGMFLASTGGPREEAWREIQHYAAQYAEEGPLTIYEVTRREVLTTTAPDSALGGKGEQR